jgi:hypothetical protein
LGLEAERILTPRSLAEALKYFESLQFEFNPYDGECPEDFEIPMVGAPSIESVDLGEGYLRLSK